jgi:hypothetical protein
MPSEWGAGGQDDRGDQWFDDPASSQVVPADGDPEVGRYKASMSQQHQPLGGYRLWMWGPRGIKRRPSLRRWALTLAAVALVIVLIRPLLVLAAIMVAGIIGLILFALLVAVGLWVAARFALGGRLAYPSGRRQWTRRWMRR